LNEFGTQLILMYFREALILGENNADPCGVDYLKHGRVMTAYEEVEI